jgi:hypothetical protein
LRHLAEANDRNGMLSGRVDPDTNVPRADRRAAMPPANPRRSARYGRLATRLPVGIAIALGCCVGAAPPAGAEPDSADIDPNAFGTLSSSGRETAPPGSVELRDEINRGIREGLSARVPGLPAPDS